MPTLPTPHIMHYMEKSNLIGHLCDIIPEDSCFELRVTGYSMLPLLGYNQDRIVVKRVDETFDINNRIAMFRTKQGKIIVHRVVCVVDDMVVMQGDGNLQGVEQCLRAEVIGVVESVIRKSGKIVSCTSCSWRLKESIWLGLPYIVRRYTLALLRRWLDRKRK